MLHRVSFSPVRRPRFSSGEGGAGASDNFVKIVRHGLIILVLINALYDDREYLMQLTSITHLAFGVERVFEANDFFYAVARPSL